MKLVLICSERASHPLKSRVSVFGCDCGASCSGPRGDVSVSPSGSELHGQPRESPRSQLSGGGSPERGRISPEKVWVARGAPCQLTLFQLKKTSGATPQSPGVRESGDTRCEDWKPGPVATPTPRRPAGGSHAAGSGQGSLVSGSEVACRVHCLQLRPVRRPLTARAACEPAGPASACAVGLSAWRR